jgi:hypothetical protein
VLLVAGLVLMLAAARYSRIVMVLRRRLSGGR